MEILKLILVTVGLLAVIVGFFFLAFSFFKKNDTNYKDCSTTGNNSNRTYFCGCRSGACGLPTGKTE